MWIYRFDNATSRLNINYGNQGFIQCDPFVRFIMFHSISKITSLKTDVDTIFGRKTSLLDPYGG